MLTKAGRWCFLLMASVVCVSVLAGCQDPHTQSPAAKVATMPTEPDIIKILFFVKDRYSCWLYTEDKSRVHGIYISGLYLIGPGGKGVFGDGVINPKLYILEKDAKGRRTPQLVKEWSFTVAEAMQWRSKKETMLGYGYALPLLWGDLSLDNKEARIVVQFERPDGKVIASSKLDAMVPPGAG